jgi:replicative DNA helicase
MSDRFILSADQRGEGESWWTGEPAARLERSILGSLLIDGETLPRVAAVLSRDDFETEPHRRLFDAMLAVKAPDLVSVAHELDRNGWRDITWPYLSSLVDAAPAVDHVVQHARKMKECSAVRRAKRSAK